MNVTVEETGPCRKTLRIEIPAERVDNEYQQLLKQYMKVAKVKGFRPGKAPVKVVERLYSKNLAEEVRDRLVPEGYQQAIKDQNIQVVTVLDLKDMDFELGKPMTFNVVLDVPPDFTLPDYKSLKLEEKPVEVTDAQVDETINSLREQYAHFEEVTGRAVVKGDLVQVDYEGTVDGASIEEMGEETKGLGVRKDFWVLADDSAFLPEFADGLAGCNAGDQKQITVNFKEDFAVEALAGKTAVYDVSVKAMREKKLPPLDEEFIKKLGLTSEDELRERIRTDMVRSARQREVGRLRSEVMDFLLKNTEMDVPESSVERETSQIIRDIIGQNTRRGVPEQELQEKRAEIMEAAGRNARDRVKAQFVLDRIGNEEKVEATPQEFNQHLTQLAMQYGMTPDALRTELKKKEALDDVEAEHRRSLVVEHLLKQAGVSLED